jgi:hypothetical protein
VLIVDSAPSQSSDPSAQASCVARSVPASFVLGASRAVAPFESGAKRGRSSRGVLAVRPARRAMSFSPTSPCCVDGTRSRASGRHCSTRLLASAGGASERASASIPTPSGLLPALRPPRRAAAARSRTTRRRTGPAPAGSNTEEPPGRCPFSRIHRRDGCIGRDPSSRYVRLKIGNLPTCERC